MIEFLKLHKLLKTCTNWKERGCKKVRDMKYNFLHLVMVGVTVTGHKKSEGANDTKDFGGGVGAGAGMGLSLPHYEGN